MLSLTIDDTLLQQRIDLVGATDDQINAARASALRKMNKKVETVFKREAAKRLRIPQRAIAGRFFSANVALGDEEMRVWIGTYSVTPFAIGAPRAYGVPGRSGGVRAGRRVWPGAFMAKVYSGQEKVWIRLHSKHYSPELYPTSYRPGDRGAGDSRGRFPVVRAAVPIDAVMRDVVEKYGDDFGNEFEVVFLRELNYQVNVKGATA